MLSGNDLDPYRIVQPEGCWWCGSSLDPTGQHKFKASDLRKIGVASSSRKATEEFVWGNDSEMRTVRSTGDALLRFSRTLCATCNNVRSQPFDRAWDQFADFAAAHQDLEPDEPVRLSEFYGNGWPDNGRHLARYMGKQMGCLLVESGFSPPESLREFLNMKTRRPSDIAMSLGFHVGIRAFAAAVEADGEGMRGLFLLPGFGEVSRSRRVLTRYAGGYFFGAIGIVYEWSEGSGDQLCFFDSDCSVPVVIGNTEQ